MARLRSMPEALAAIDGRPWLGGFGATARREGKIYADGTLAVEDLDLEIQDGEFMVFVGPSGCGKTTALRMVAGLEDITRSTVTIK